MAPRSQSVPQHSLAPVTLTVCHLIFRFDANWPILFGKNSVHGSARLCDTMAQLKEWETMLGPLWPGLRARFKVGEQQNWARERDGVTKCPVCRCSFRCPRHQQRTRRHEPTLPYSGPEVRPVR